MLRRSLVALVLAALAAALVACGAAPQAPTALPPTAVPPAPTAPAAPGGAGDVVPQDIISAIFADLAGRIGGDPAGFSVVVAEAVTWPDGSLGCPQPGMMYPQVLTDGFRVVVESDGAEYAYHGDERGQFVYCENPAR